MSPCFNIEAFIKFLKKRERTPQNVVQINEAECRLIGCLREHKLLKGNTLPLSMQSL